MRLAIILGIAVAAVVAAGCAGTKPVPLVDDSAVRAAADEEARRKADEWARAQAEARAKAEAEAAAREARLRAEAGAVTQEVGPLGPVYFDYDDFQIRQDQQDVLAGQAEQLKGNPQTKLTLEGHCDERGTIEYNLALGQRRANSVKFYLVRAGVAADRLGLVSYGKQRPADAGHSEAAWAKNRRVEFVAAQ